jgi:hypothetical protein
VKVIGLTGFASVGKSTVAQYLVEEHGFTRLSFAAPLKKMLRTLNPIVGAYDADNSCGDPDCCGGPWPSIAEVNLSDLFDQGMTENQIKESKYGPEYRRLLQVLGADCIRAIDPQFWVKAAIMQLVGQDGKYVFDDVRFPNEAEVIKGFAGDRALWNIQRPGYHAANGHASEQHAGHMGEGWMIHNAISVDFLHESIDDALAIAFAGV